MSAARAIVAVELRRFLRDRSNIFFVFVFPIALVAFIGAQFGGAATTSVGVVAPPSDRLAGAIVAHLDADDALDIVEVADRDELVTMVSRNRLAAGIVFPPDFARAIAEETAADVQFVGRADGTAAGVRTALESALDDVLLPVAAGRIAAEVTSVPPEAAIDMARNIGADRPPTIAVELESYGHNERLQELAGLGPFDLGASQQLFLFVFLTTVAGSAALIQARQWGVTTRMYATSASPWSIVAGFGGGRLAVALFQASYIVVFTALAFGVDWGNPWATGALIVAFSLVSAAAAMLVGAVFSNDSQASGIGVGAGLILAALGGSMMPLDFFPEAMRTVARMTPHGWANEAMADIIRHDAGIAEILTPLLMLLAVAIALGLLGAAALRRSIIR
ncbi:MAG: ABC transporter permease [Nitriliruptoraceae bacterium]